MATDIRITIEQEKQFRAWSKDPVRFCCEVVKITDTKGKTVPFNMQNRPYQIDCMNRFLRTQVCAVLKARQIGLTTMACGLALWLLLFHPDRFILVLSKNDEDAKKFLRRIRIMYDRLPDWVKARGPQLVGRWGKHEAEFDNGSVIYSATSSSDHGRGDTPTDVFLDEVGKMRNQEDSWTALVPATEAGGNLWMFGTANGFRDWFHLRWMEWKMDPDIDTIFYGWRAVPGRDESWAQRMRRRLGDALFKREYPETDDEAFLMSGSNVFSVEVLVEIEPEQPMRYRLEKIGGFWQAVEEATHDDEFGLFIFEMPEPGAKYLTAADPSEGLVDGDPSVIQVLKWSGRKLRQVAVFRSRLEPDDFTDIDHALSIFYNRATVLFERNNHGITMGKRFRQLRTPNVVHGKGKSLGLWTSASSKGANIAITRKKLADGLLELLDERTITELLGFQEKKNKQGNIVFEGTEHDDHVDSLCIGVGYADAHTPEERPADEEEDDEPAPVYSLEWFQAQRVRGTAVI